MKKLGGDVDGTCLAAGTVAGEGSTGRGGGTGAEDLAGVGCFAKVDGGECLQEIESGRVCGEDVETFTKDQYIWGVLSSSWVNNEDKVLESTVYIVK